MRKPSKTKLNELINSGIDLKDYYQSEERFIVEENIFDHSEEITPYQLNSLRCRGILNSEKRGW